MDVEYAKKLRDRLEALRRLIGLKGYDIEYQKDNWVTSVFLPKRAVTFGNIIYLPLDDSIEGNFKKAFVMLSGVYAAICSEDWGRYRKEYEALGAVVGALVAEYLRSNSVGFDTLAKVLKTIPPRLLKSLAKTRLQALRLEGYILDIYDETRNPRWSYISDTLPNGSIHDIINLVHKIRE